MADGILTRGVLRSRYTAVLPNIYVAKDTELTLEVRARAALLWTGDTGIIAGRTAAALYRNPSAVTTAPIELIARHTRHPVGLTIRNERISVDEITLRVGLPITNRIRTALDIARHLPRDEAVTLLDPFTAAGGITKADIWELAERYPGARDIRTADLAIQEIDPGAENPEETRVRLILADAGHRPTHSQIRITDGYDEALVAMGWPRLKVGVGCGPAGAHAVATAEFLQHKGWRYVHADPQDTSTTLVYRVRRALWSRPRRPN